MRKRKKAARVRTDCKQITALLDDYLSDRLSPKLKRDFEQHLDTCPDCVSFLNTYKKTLATTQALEPPALPSKVRNKLRAFLRQRRR
jgi:anti-sigma factor RsiW